LGSQARLLGEVWGRHYPRVLPISSSAARTPTRLPHTDYSTGRRRIHSCRLYIMKFRLEPSVDKVHKWVGVFTDPITKDERRVSFGAKGYEDYTQHHDRLRRANYLSRHRTRENWNNPMSAGALSRWILWNTQDLQRNVSQFRRRFNLD